MHSIRPERPVIRLGLAALVSLAGAALGAAACLDRPVCDLECRPRTSNTFVDTVSQKAVDKIDLLFMIDNSSSMADKQAVLQAAVPDLVQRLVSPNCIKTGGEADKAHTPTDPAASCPPGETREFAPIRDIHVGVITSSLGGHGSTTLCQAAEGAGIVKESADDHGHLIATRPRFAVALQASPGAQPPDPAGFLDWNPDANKGQQLEPFNTTFKVMTTGVGEVGCGLESQLESIYRFLIDPAPPQTINTASCPGSNQPCAVPVGKDEALLAQRKAFLRPDSLVSIIMVTDENDCSVRESQQFYYAARSEITLPPGSAACATNPNDRCCYSCATAPPAGCVADPTCLPRSDPSTDAGTTWAKEVDQPNLRCFQEKKRFGLDFLYPTARYVNALSKPRLCTSLPDLNPDPSKCPDLNGDHQPDIVPNPLFQDLRGQNAVPRDPALVFLAGIVGVPWQDLAARADKAGKAYPPEELHYKTARQLADDGTWAAILGKEHPPGNAPPISPTDALMVESTTARGGVDGQGRPLAAPSAGFMANPVNGHEWGNKDLSDLQYACIFPLKEARDCAELARSRPGVKCDCSTVIPGDANPLCQDPTGAFTTKQSYAKAYPGLRELSVLQDFGDNSIVASICARNLTGESAQDYGYRPAVDAIVDRLKEVLGGRCLPRVISTVPDPKDPTKSVIPCSVIEARPYPPGNPGCDPAKGRGMADPKVVDSVLARLQEKGLCGTAGRPSCHEFYLCEIKEAGLPCHTDEQVTPATLPVPGWCYVDPLNNPKDNPALVAGCAPSRQRLLRFVDATNATPAHDATVLITCSGGELLSDRTIVTMAPRAGDGG
jgi:hypothetical protein